MTATVEKYSNHNSKISGLTLAGIRWFQLTVLPFRWRTAYL